MIGLPGAIQIKGLRTGGLPEARRRRQDPSKLTIHSTETPAGTGRSVISRLEWPYSVLADPETREVFQVLPLENTAYSLRGTHAATGQKIETNHSGLMHPQLSLIGYAAQMPNLTQAQLEWLADDVIGPIMDLCGIQNRWAAAYGPGDGFVLATPFSKVRWDQQRCWDWSGVLFHQTWWGNDHWDPGKLDTEFLADRLDGLLPSKPQPTPPSGRVLGHGDQGDDVWVLQHQLNQWFQAGLSADSIFGDKTEAAVRAAQAVLGVTVDGFWGPKTAAQFESYVRAAQEAQVQPPTPPPTPPALPPVTPPALPPVTLPDPPPGPRPLVADVIRAVAQDLEAEKAGLQDLMDTLDTATGVLRDAEILLRAPSADRG